MDTEAHRSRIKRPRSLQWMLCIVLPWLIVLGIRPWRAALDEQMARTDLSADPAAADNSWSCAVLPCKGTGEGDERAAVERNIATYDTPGHARNYRHVVQLIPDEEWPRARWLNITVRDAALRTTVLETPPPLPPAGVWMPPGSAPPPTPVFKFQPPAIAEQRLVRELAAQGRRREPDNAFFDLALSCHQLLANQTDAALASLARAARCKRYDSHIYDALGACVSRIDQEQNLSLGRQARIWQSQLPVIFLDDFGKRLGLLAIRARQQRRHEVALNILRDATRVGRLVADGRADAEERNQGRALQNTVWRSVAGWPDFAVYERYIERQKLTNDLKAQILTVARVAANYAAAQGRPELKSEVLRQAHVSGEEAVNSADDSLEKLEEALIPVEGAQWQLQCFLLAQAVIALLGIVLVRFARGREPAAELTVWQVIGPQVAGCIMAGTALYLAILSGAGPATEGEPLLYGAAYALAPGFLLFWWSISGLSRCRGTLLPVPEVSMQSGERFVIWRVITMAVALSPLLLTGLLASVYLFWRILGLGEIAPSLKNLGVGELHGRGLFGAATLGIGAFTLGYLMFFFTKWRLFAPPAIRAEVNRSLTGCGRGLALLLLWAGWGYLASGVGFIPAHERLAKAIAAIQVEGGRGASPE